MHGGAWLGYDGLVVEGTSRQREGEICEMPLKGWDIPEGQYSSDLK